MPLRGNLLAWLIVGIVVLSIMCWPVALVLGIVLLFVSGGRYRTVGIVGTAAGGFWAVMTVVIAAAVILVAGSISGHTLNASSVELTIEQQSGRLYTNVECPSNMREIAGRVYGCTADDGAKIAVTTTDDVGDYTWVPTN